MEYLRREEVCQISIQIQTPFRTHQQGKAKIKNQLQTQQGSHNQDSRTMSFSPSEDG